MTERLYYHDPALLDFDASVLELAGDAQHVVLDRTAFYPTSGGQPHDTGVLGAARVIDVMDQDDRVIHVVDTPLGLGPIHGAVDPGRRRDHRQQHSAQHLLSALAADHFGWDTASVHFGAEHSTIEFATAAASDAQMTELERRANEIVAEARPVSISFEHATAAERAGLRKPSGRSGEIRVITIKDLDRSACGGTHVSRTSEIGTVLLVGVEKIRGHVRVGFLAGDRVLAHARASDAALAALARELGWAVSELGTLMPARQQETRTLRDQVSKLEQEVAGARVRAMHEATAPGNDGIRRIMHRATDESAALLRLMAQAVGQLARTAFVAISASPPAIYFATSADSGVNAGAALKPALSGVGGRGGGSERVAQGTAPSVEALEQVAAGLVSGSFP